MNNKWLAITIVLLVGLLYLTLGKSTDDHQQLVFPQFARFAEQAKVLTIQTGTDAPLQISFNTKSAIADSYHGYKVDLAKLRGILLQLQRLEIRELKTAKPENYHYLGLDESQRLQIRLQISPDHESLMLQLGKEAVGGRFARQSTQPQSYLVDWQLPVSGSALQWLDRSIIDIDAADISTISNDRGLSLSRNSESAVLAIEGVSGEVKDYEVNRLASLFTRWQFLDVQPLSEQGLFKPELTTITLLSEAKKIVLATGKLDDKYWLYLHSSSTAITSQPWLYEISEYDYELLTADKTFFIVESVPETESQ